METEDYSKGGEEHTVKDTKLTREKADEIQNELNGHSSIWQKILNMGQDHQQEERIRGNILSKNPSIPNMSTLIKDYKSVKNRVARMRPVVNGNSGMNAPLNDIINPLLEHIVREGINRIEY